MDKRFEHFKWVVLRRRVNGAQWEPFAAFTTELTARRYAQDLQKNTPEDFSVYPAKEE